MQAPFDVVKAVEGVALAAEKALDIGVNLTDAEQQKIKYGIKAAKLSFRKEEVARQMQDGRADTAFFGDNSFIGTDIIIENSDIEERQKDQYRKLKDEFNSNKELT